MKTFEQVFEQVCACSANTELGLKRKISECYDGFLPAKDRGVSFSLYSQYPNTYYVSVKYKSESEPVLRFTVGEVTLNTGVVVVRPIDVQFSPRGEVFG